jgi:hypothetical protein
MNEMEERRELRKARGGRVVLARCDWIFATVPFYPDGN